MGVNLLRTKTLAFAVSSFYAGIAGALLSIIFGLALTNLLSGMLRAFFRRELTDTRIAWTILVGNLLLVPRFGYPAAAWTTLAAFALYPLLVAVRARAVVRWAETRGCPRRSCRHRRRPPAKGW